MSTELTVVVAMEKDLIENLTAESAGASSGIRNYVRAIGRGGPMRPPKTGQTRGSAPTQMWSAFTASYMLKRRYRCPASCGGTRQSMGRHLRKAPCVLHSRRLEAPYLFRMPATSLRSLARAMSGAPDPSSAFACISAPFSMRNFTVSACP